MNHIVDLLTRLLAKAEKGEIIGIAVATVTPDLCTGSSYKLGDSTLAELLGSVTLLQWRMMEAADQPIVDTDEPSGS